MEERQLIIIWDDLAQRINAMEPALQQALKALNIDSGVQINCEVPLLSRHQLIGRTPSIQVNDGDFWSCTYGEPITEGQFIWLLTHLKKCGLVK